MNFILSEWREEVDDSIMASNSFCIGLFSDNGKTLFMNNSMFVFTKGKTVESFINPTFSRLLSLDDSNTLIFEGFLTIGDYNSVNSSIWVRIFRKKNKILVLGGEDTGRLIEQNNTMHVLNRQVSNLYRQLIQEKHVLQTTLSQLNNANHELNRINKSKDRFISILAHDLKSPFSSILGLLELLGDNVHRYDLNKTKKMVELIYKTSQSTYDLLEDILLWVKTESGSIDFKPKTHKFSEIYSGAIKTLEPVAKRKDIEIKYLPTRDITLYADRYMIQTVLRNLISNAIKFTMDGGRVIVSAKEDKSATIVTVEDNGIGIPPETLEVLFEITSKITTEGTAHEKGTGLGLILCKELIERHGGEIIVESELEKGSVFKFSLPKQFKTDSDS